MPQLRTLIVGLSRNEQLYSKGSNIKETGKQIARMYDAKGK